MIIKSIKMENFRQYKGTTTMTFSTDEKKNVTVVIGKNTSGKTTLVHAFYWCLYGKSRFSNDALLNKELVSSLSMMATKEVAVEVVLVHDGMQFTVTRRTRYKKNSSDDIRAESKELKVCYLDENGATVYLKEVDTQNTINKILPEELADYFFFDGERINRHE
jgi:DNA sulfur modification protein DndD